MQQGKLDTDQAVELAQIPEELALCENDLLDGTPAVTPAPVLTAPTALPSGPVPVAELETPVEDAIEQAAEVPGADEEDWPR